jgi:pSer/pThr/pTyr-binding forkhead associated (FHA) protein
MACLLVITGRQAGTYYPLAGRTLSIGRDPARDIQLRDAKVSRRHFLIRKDGADYVVFESRSKNGVFVNDARVGERILADGDRIRVGDTVLVFHAADVPERGDGFMEYRKATTEFRESRTSSG